MLAPAAHLQEVLDDAVRNDVPDVVGAGADVLAERNA